ncbi:alpha/beta hydrolase [Streptomyces sp. SID10815]|uniref:alpha/beta fold hydrolase n=1 Tax=Streptomyces sp. SID10815 TaxID=2706027 RepID=UPI0013C73E98|nr:alpha/beta hydrolase [Streptomyces sp. SID10815]NEA45665.1 alpha/beta hydrolase [Streptomyces sp. SID10815]
MRELNREPGELSATTLVLLHSPLVNMSSWGRTAECVEALGPRCVAVEVDDDLRPPYGLGYARCAADRIAGSVGTGPVVLVGHSGAGPVLPAVTAALHGRVTVVGELYCDANLPRAGASRVDLMRHQGADFENFRAELANGRRYPDWSDEELTELLPDPLDRKTVLAGVRQRGEDFYLEPLPIPDSVPEIGRGFLRLCAGYEFPAAEAERRGWPIIRLDQGHFHPLVDPEETARALVAVAARLVAAA